MRYEEVIALVCGENWKTSTDEDRQGGYGVAIVAAFIEGAVPQLKPLAVHLLTMEEFKHPNSNDVEALMKELEIPYLRLQASGIFTPKFSARRDRALNGEGNAQDGRTAWCHIAGVAAGLVGQNENTSKVTNVT